MSTEIPWHIFTPEMRNIYKDSDIEALLLKDYDPHEDYYPFNESEYITIEEYEGHDFWVNKFIADQKLDGRYITFNGRYITHRPR